MASRPSGLRVLGGGLLQRRQRQPAVVRPGHLACRGDEHQPGLVLHAVAVGHPARLVEGDRIAERADLAQVALTAAADGSVTVSSTAVRAGRWFFAAAATYELRPVSSAFRSEVSVSQVAKKTTSRGLPGPRATVGVPDPAPVDRAAGSETAAAGVCTSMAPSDPWLSSFG